MFKFELDKILHELNNYKRDKFDLLTMYIINKLDASLQTYSSDLQTSKRYLEFCNSAKVARRIGKLK